ncbi:hypothetical protein BDN72DRAFT_837018 [Pluteus cervinus]|uniref:Uncharacterized protein n=1 Tax=Pluteus cervinus TaxID=181527 RepID=A0ACD3B1N1_9AGAR|nr:hypothetical protein BDN72DRAFT_837018 [Pluteus cervinus]
MVQRRRQRLPPLLLQKLAMRSASSVVVPRAAIAPLPTHITSRLAAEITDRILDELHDSKPSLSLCSVVCKSWFPRCRYHLFSDVRLTEKFVRSVESSPNAKRSIEPYIRSVALGGGWAREELDWDKIVSFFQGLQRVDRLELETWSWSYLSASSARVLLSGMGSIFQTIRTLKLTYIRFTSFQKLVSFVGRFSRLEDLMLDNVSWDQEEESQDTNIESLEAPPFGPPRQLRRISIRASPNRALLLWLLFAKDRNQDASSRMGHEHALPLRTLILPEILPSESALVARLLQASGSSLEHLELGFLTHHSDEATNLSLIRAIDLHDNDRLRYLKIHQLTLYQVSPFTPTPTRTHFDLTIPTTMPYQWFIPLLRSLHSTFIENITLGLWVSDELQLDMLPWTELVSLLEDAIFGSLRYVAIQVNGTGDDPDAVLSWLTSRTENPHTRIHVQFSDSNYH